MIGSIGTRFTIWYVRQGYTYTRDTFYYPLWVRPLLIFFSPVRYYAELYGKIFTECFAEGFAEGYTKFYQNEYLSINSLEEME